MELPSEDGPSSSPSLTGESSVEPPPAKIERYCIRFTNSGGFGTIIIKWFYHLKMVTTNETVVHLGIHDDRVWYLLISYTSSRACRRTCLTDSGTLQIKRWLSIRRKHRDVAD